MALAILCLTAHQARSQQAAFSGQASAWLASKPDSSLVSQAGVRYIPEVALQHPWSGGDSLALDLSLNAVLAGTPSGPDATLKPYRAWLRFATHTFETRIGLQKINFGSATLFRPLMWFDRVDPRDPLQLTDGVTGALARYYFPNNANLWAWALVGNTAPKGWETAPTERGSVEYGGRVQLPVPAGEVGATYHHRSADLQGLAGAVPEDRYALDGRWNLGIGLWGEGALVHQRTAALPSTYQRFWSVGADYTIGVGNGLYVLAEQARFDTPATSFGGGPGAAFSGLLMNYPVGIVDRVSAMVYRNWTARQWYRILTWQRTYDVWTFYLLAFWNPAQPLGLGLGAGTQTQTFAGRGLQLMAAFNY
ncbi:MAG: hypothetical protein ABR998_08370 [Gemmatimonadales bacterium]